MATASGKTHVMGLTGHHYANDSLKGKKVACVVPNRVLKE